MIFKKKYIPIFVMAIALILSGCSSDNKKETASLSQDLQSTESVTDNETLETKEENKDSIVSSDKPQDQSKTENKTDKTTSKSKQKPNTKPSGNTVTKPNTSTSTTAKPNKPNNSTINNGSTTKPSGGNTETSSKPEKHVHNWKKQPKGQIMEWENLCGPDENGYTTNSEIAQDKSGHKIGIYMCAKCYKFFGSRYQDEWETRYWNHIEEPGPCLGCGYSNYPLYAVYELYHCKECDSWKRGKISAYYYYDYSNHGVKAIYLEPWQIKELNLVMP